MSVDTFRALVVDDEPLLRQMMVRALKEVSFECKEAADGEEAIELVAQMNYDVVITDMRMPGRDGRDLVEHVLGLPNRPSTLMLTGVLEPSLGRELMALGVDDISFKPIDFRAYSGKVLGIAERRRLLSRQRETPYGGENKRRSFRASIADDDLKVRIRLGDSTVDARGRNLSTGGVLVELPSSCAAPLESPVEVILEDDLDQLALTGVIRRLDGRLCGVEFDEFHERRQQSSFKSLSRMVTQLQRR